MIVSCAAWPSLGYRGQHNVERGIGILQSHANRDNVNRLQRMQACTEIHGILFCGDKRWRACLLSQALQIAHVLIGVTMMVPKNARAGKHDLRRFQLRNKVFRSRDAAEREARLQGVGGDELATYAPDKLVS